MLNADILQDAGLTATESRVYRALLGLGEASMAAVTRAVGSHPHVVYRAVDALAQKGLVVVTSRRGRRQVRAEDPGELLKLQQARLQELKQALPQLRGEYKKGEQTIIKVQRGGDAIYQVRERAFLDLKRGETLYVLGASGDRYYQIMGKRHAALEKRRIARKIKKKLVTFESQREGLVRNEPYSELAQVRYLPNVWFVPSSTNIFGDTVVVYVWSQDPAAIVIESPEMAQSYRHYFDELWKQAKP